MDWSEVEHSQVMQECTTLILPSNNYHDIYRIYLYYALHIIHREVTEACYTGDSGMLSELTLDPPV